ncbi:hypothetical protein [Bradyrhizobium sp. LHD-71]|uniref:hypothetical protein n=1 Tax=Bradyrhizobium sp. LHD-71 TaxID=3072141 RepID=UPI00280DB7AF|nr:hypothetical protein [Bradyrhizobium sp. LHD-71]MDQ8729515.1 hypothetical protein [Bradyrhizobium sp. LHD-71]
MQDDQDLREDQDDRRNAMTTGVIVSVLAIFGVVALTMWYGGWFGGAESGGSASAPTASQTAPAPSGSVGQAPQNPGPPQTNR